MRTRDFNHRSSIYVVTAGVSVRGNLSKLTRLPYAEPDEALPTLFRDCLACIGSFPDRRTPADEVPEALGLALLPSAEPEGDQPQEQRSSAPCADAESLKLIAERLVSTDDRPGTRGMSAELSSLFADFAEDTPLPNDSDHIVLVASDSDIGIRCAGIVGAVLLHRVGGTFRRVNVGKPAAGFGLPCGGAAGSDLDDTQLAGRLTEPGVTVAVVEGLTANAEYAVGRSARGLARVLGSAYAAARADDRRLALHPIGGYKATIPLFTALAAHLPTQHGVDVEMWSNHEQTPIGLRQPLLRLGVPDAEYWDLQDLARSPESPNGDSTKERQVRLRSSRWNDYAWEDDEDERPRLTDVGWAIVALRAACDQEPGRSNGE